MSLAQLLVAQANFRAITMPVVGLPRQPMRKPDNDGEKY